MWFNNPGKDFCIGGGLSLVLVIAGGLSLLSCGNSEPSSRLAAAAVGTGLMVAETDTIPPDTVPADPVTYSIVGVGDMMLGTSYPSTSYLPPNGGKDLLAPVADLLRDADVTFGNLEGTIIDKGGTPKTCSNPSICYVFRSPETYVQHFVDAGFDLLSIANNHSGDFGPEGRRRTKEVLQEAGIGFAGLAGTDEKVIIERNGLRFGFCAFAPNSGTCDIRNISRAKAIVSELAQEADIVIVSFHGGAEGESKQHVTRSTETYYGENRGNVYAFAHAVVDAGADIVFGHGPHVTRAMELYQDRLICYSLGNFCTYGRFNLNGAAGISPLVRVEVDKNGQFVSGNVTATYQQKTHGPRIDSQKRVISKLMELSKADFPESPLVITSTGELRR